jgi:putative tryptophan/tyrosine transport system substrate-binding protein
LPGAARFAVFVNPTNPVVAEPFVKDVQAAAAAIGRQIEVFTAANNRDIDAAFASLVQKRAEAFLVSPDGLFSNRRVQIVTLAARHAVPAIYTLREYTEVGGLMSYGPSNADQIRETGIYAARILKGERPADLPVLRPSKFEFVINLQTARIIRLDVPATLLASADEVIE